MSDGTVLHEIQSLEKQLDRLVPTLETFNSRISTIEADVRNIVHRLNILKCSAQSDKLNHLGTDLSTLTVELRKDLEALSKDVDELAGVVRGIQAEKNEEYKEQKQGFKEEKRVLGSRLWSIIEKILGPLIGAAVTYLILGGGS